MTQELAWHRDPIEMYSFHVTVPPGIKEIQAGVRSAFRPTAQARGLAASSNLLDLNWNQVVFYPDKALRPTRSNLCLQCACLQVGNMERL